MTRRTVLGYAIQDLSIRVDLHVSRAIVRVARRGNRGDVCQQARVDVACVHFYAICSEHRDERTISRKAEFNAVGAGALI